MVKPELIEAYCAAKYVVNTSTENAVMRVGQRSAQVAELIATHQAQSAAFITPCNPLSAELDNAENDERYQRFIAHIKADDYAFFEGYGVDDLEEWRREASALVLNISQQAADELAAWFDQNAYLWFGADGLVSLRLAEFTSTNKQSPGHLSELGEELVGYHDVQWLGDVKNTAVCHALLPRYDYPAVLDSGLTPAFNILHHWHANLERLSSESEETLQTLQPALAGYVDWLLSNMGKRRGGGYWSVLEESTTLPSDAYTDFVKQPTCIALATLVALKDKLPSSFVHSARMDRAITRVSKFVQRRNAWRGNGYDTHSSMCDFLAILNKADVIKFWLAREAEFPDLLVALREVAHSMAAKPERWSGEIAGYSRISDDDRLNALTLLAPLTQGDK